MNTQDIKTKIEELKTSCIDSTEDGFIQYLIDEYNPAVLSTMIISYDLRYQYWLFKSSVVNDLLIQVDESQKELLIDLLRLKSIIDKHLLDLKPKEVIEIDCGNKFDTHNNLSELLEEPILSKVVHSVYQALWDNGKVEESYSDFKNQFINP